MKSKNFKVMSIFLSMIVVLNVGIFGLSFGDTKATNSIGDRVWNDSNSNGIQDIGEGFVQGVRVSLYDAYGNFLGSTTTASDGYYKLVTPGNGGYIVKFDESSFPNGYFETKRKRGSNRYRDSDGVEAPAHVFGGNNHSIDLGLTNQPYNVRISEKVAVFRPFPNPVGTLYRNKIKTVYGTKNLGSSGEYLKIWYKGNWGYVNRNSKDYNMIKQLEYNVKITSEDTGDIIVYQTPYGEVIGTLPYGTVKTVYGERFLNENKLWYRVWYNGGPGYINAMQTEKLDYNVRVTDKTRVRAYPRGPALTGYLNKNKIKTAYGYKTDNYGAVWYRVWYNGQYGYLYKLCTSRNLTSVPNFNVRLNYNLTVRSSVWGTALGTIPSNTVKTVYGQRLDRDGETWYRVWYNGGPGYIRAKYTTKQ